MALDLIMIKMIKMHVLMIKIMCSNDNQRVLMADNHEAKHVL